MTCQRDVGVCSVGFAPNRNFEDGSSGLGVCGLEVEDEFTNSATRTGQKELGLENGGPAGVVMCETRDLGIKCPCWHILTFEDVRK